MNITESTATQLTIRGLDNLDSINVFIEDIAPKVGRITIESFGDAWSHAWGGMWDGYSAAEFFARCDDGYLLGKFARASSNMECIDFEALIDKLKTAVIEQRKDGDMSSTEARETWDKVEEIERHEGMTVNEIHAMDSIDIELISDLLGEEWYHSVPEKPSREARRLKLIIQAVREAFIAKGWFKQEVAA
ncbi:hypothetical protein NDQ72_11065 [Halomonas sp. KG2]|uniref:hypothetical protein n=1 Tax=Halomonas sp. KG2 TaxID=2951138 RepID=UPI0026473B02|nr:hypothetical protein [Halomonas sp. KG2]WKD26615.1 hypothetical protein NDQ72_11065 [Halomonas sp. KG2]